MIVIRLAAVAAVVAGVATLAVGLAQLVYTQPDTGWRTVDVLYELGFAVSLLAAIIALQGLPARLGAGVVVRGFTVLAQVALGLVLVASLSSAAARQNVLGAVFAAGLLMALVGLLGAGVAGAITGSPRWLAAVPFVGLLLSVALPLPALGQSLLGVAWLVLAGMLLAPQRGRSVVAS